MQSIKEYVEKKKRDLKEKIDSLAQPPTLVIVQVGDVEASNRYVKNKLKDCSKVGINARLLHFESTITTEELVHEIGLLNKDDAVTGFIVQLPLPKQINISKISNAIAAIKDVDGFSKLALVNPCTPAGIIDYLTDYGFEFKNKNVVVIGRSEIVGRPIARMLLDLDSNVEVIHSKTSAFNKERALLLADLIIVATGHRNTLVNSDVMNTAQKCFIIDVGINMNEDGKLCGDCEKVTERPKTPVPGGVGLLTRLALTKNLLKLFELQQKK